MGRSVVNVGRNLAQVKDETKKYNKHFIAFYRFLVEFKFILGMIDLKFLFTYFFS